jgi:hypothetical protein
MNSLFRKNNLELDTLEESDDEGDDASGVKMLVKCYLHETTKKWQPVIR